MCSHLIYSPMDFKTGYMLMTHVSISDAHLSSIHISTSMSYKFLKIHVSKYTIFTYNSGTFPVSLILVNLPPSTHLLKPEAWKRTGCCHSLTTHIQFNNRSYVFCFQNRLWHPIVFSIPTAPHSSRPPPSLA